MTFKIALNFEDGVTRFIDCNATETVADAAYRQGVNVPIDCRDGACGACKCKAESGQYELGFYIDDAMSEEEAKLGYVLTCQMHPKSDCVVNIPASSEVCKIKHATLTATVGEDVPTFAEVQEKIELRYARAKGMAELHEESVPNRMLEVEQATLEAEAVARLDSEADFALLPATIAYELMATDAAQRLEFAGPPESGHGLGGTAHLVLRSGDDSLSSAVNRAIAAIRGDGSFARIVRQHLPVWLD